MQFLRSSWSRKGFICLLASALFCLCPRAFAGGSSYADYPQEMRRILERGELIVAMPQTDILPFFYAKDGELRGADVDLARGLARRLRVKLTFNRSAKNYSGVIDVIARGDADLAICMLSRTFTRARLVRFSEPYLTLHHAMAANQARLAKMAKSEDPRTVIQHFSGSVGVLASSSYVEFAQSNFPKAKVIAYGSWSDAIAAVKRGEVDAVYNDEFQIKQLMQSDARNSLTLRTFEFTDTQDPLSIAVRHDSLQLLSLVNLYLSQQTEPLGIKALLKRAKNP